MLTSLKIQDYRGISTLELPQLSRVNIFIGKNGTRKTSVLECAALASSLSPQYHLLFGQWRDMSDGQDILRSAFYDLDTFNPIKIYFQRDIEEYLLKIEVKHGPPKRDEQGNQTFDNPNLDGNISSVTHHYTHFPQDDNSAQSGVIYGQLHGNQIYIIDDDMNELPPGCFYIPTRRSSSVRDTAILLTELMESAQQYAEFLQILQEFDSRVQRIFVGYRAGQPTVLVDIGRDKALPINVLGDGFGRLILMLTGLLGSNATTLIIDEIDSGLHYSAMEPIWTNLLHLTTQYDKQLFCVSHNEEMLRATLNTFASEPQELSVYRFSTGENSMVKAQYYDYDLLRDSFRLDFEVR